MKNLIIILATMVLLVFVMVSFLTGCKTHISDKFVITSISKNCTYNNKTYFYGYVLDDIASVTKNEFYMCSDTKYKINDILYFVNFVEDKKEGLIQNNINIQNNAK